MEVRIKRKLSIEIQYNLVLEIVLEFTSQQVYIGEVNLEEEETQDTLITMVEKLKTNKYIRWVP